MGKRSDAVANQQKVLDAATQLFAEKGLNAEIKEIAERAGVGVGTIYRSYTDRNGLLLALTVGSINEFAALVDACMRQPDAKLALHSFVRQGLAHTEKHGWLIAAALGWQLPQASMQALAEANPAAQIELFLRRAVSEGVVREDAPLAAAALQILGHFLVWSLRASEKDADIDMASSEIVDMLLRGVGVTHSA